ncbi:hypothetical protein NQZ68_029026 [Dissostichus eleginoides]|nr:hypothetical protein NQZ68_029026 [Dissostichus eleginoides]
MGGIRADEKEMTDTRSSTFLLNAAKANVSQRQRQGLRLNNEHSSRKKRPGRCAKSYQRQIQRRVR